MNKLGVKILRQDQSVASEAYGESVSLVYTKAYEEGDFIRVECDRDEAYLMIQLDDAMGEAFVYLKHGSTDFKVPFGEKKKCYSPKSFYGEKHLLSARYAAEEEIKRYKNLAQNQYDCHESTNCFPHASANIETRGESTFAAKNAINGNHENHSHGSWPYESWGINKDPDAIMQIEFGRLVKVDQVALYIRADFPHDNWWTQATLYFSDGSEYVCDLVKTDQAQQVKFSPKTIEWIKIGKLIKADDPSPFPALSQLEVYGTEA